MRVAEAVLQRHSVRAFTDQPVANELIEEILAEASHAPSGANTQPWRVVVLSGNAKLRLQQRFEATFNSGQRGKMDYSYYPEQWAQPYLARRQACGFQLYDAVGIKREDKQQRLQQWAANYRAFDAPVMMIFLIEDIMEVGSYMDYGMFLQSLMLLALEKGLGTCPQAALGEYPDIVREQLALETGIRVLGGMALGYEDRNAAINSYRTPRETVDSFVKFYSD